MTTWNTSLTRILKLSLSLMGKNSLGLINSVCQGPGRKRVNMRARYLLSLHQHSGLFRWPHISGFFVLFCLNIQLTYFPIGYVVPVFSLIRAAYLNAAYLHFIIIALLNTVNFGGKVLFFFHWALWKILLQLSPSYLLEKLGKSRNIFFFWKQVLEICSFSK